MATSFLTNYCPLILELQSSQQATLTVKRVLQFIDMMSYGGT